MVRSVAHHPTLLCVREDHIAPAAGGYSVVSGGPRKPPQPKALSPVIHAQSGNIKDWSPQPKLNEL